MIHSLPLSRTSFCHSLSCYYLFSFAFAQTCYYPDGMLAPHDILCSADSGYGSCCRAGTYCIGDGLCIDSWNEVFRGSCTDQYWGPDCSPYCVVEFPSGDASMVSCGIGEDHSTSYTCGLETNSCTSNSFTIAPILPRRDPKQKRRVAENDFTTPEYFYRAVVRLSNLVENVDSGSVEFPRNSSIEVESLPTRLDRRIELVAMGLGVGIPLSMSLAAVSYLLWKTREELYKSEKRRTRVRFPTIRSRKSRSASKVSSTVSQMFSDGNVSLEKASIVWVKPKRVTKRTLLPELDENKLTDKELDPSSNPVELDASERRMRYIKPNLSSTRPR